MLTDADESPVLPENILLKAEKAAGAIVPQKSRKIYEKEYASFEEWLKENKIGEVINDTVMLAYFQDLSDKFAPNSLWTKFSMLRKQLIVKKKVKSTEKFGYLQEFLKQVGKGYNPKKSKVLSREQVLQFLKEAPNETYLLEKVALVVGVFGACRRDELVNMRFSDVQDSSAYISVNIPQTKNGVARSFLIIEENEMSALTLVRQYISLRPKEASDERFFLSFRANKCTRQPVGKNTFGTVPSKIAAYLGFSDAKLYTGHCLRRTAATLHSNAGGSMDSLMRLGGWKSSSVARGYVDNSSCSMQENARLVAGVDKDTISTSSSISHTTTVHSMIQNEVLNSEKVQEAGVQVSGEFKNCNFYFK